MLWLAGLMGIMAVGAASVVDVNVEDDQTEGFDEFEDGSEDPSSGSSGDMLADLSADTGAKGSTDSQMMLDEKVADGDNPMVQRLQEDLASISAMPAFVSDDSDFDPNMDLDALEQSFADDTAAQNASVPMLDFDTIEFNSDIADFASANENAILAAKGDASEEEIVNDIIEEVDETLPDSLPSFMGGTLLGGSMEDDVLTGTDGSDLIDGYGGSDVMEGGEGNDILNGMRGAGANALFGGFGEESNLSLREAAMAEAEEADALFGGDGDDLIFADGGDMVFGGAGEDDIVIGDWTSATNPVEMVDFDGSEDQLVLVWDNYSEDEPQVAISANEDDPSVMNVTLDDEVVAQVPTSSGLTVDQIALMPVSEASAMNWAWAA